MLEKRWPFISLLLFLAVLVSLWLWPSAGAILVPVLVLANLGAAIFFILRREVSLYRAGRMNRGRLARTLLVEITGLLLSILLAVYLGGLLLGVVVLHITGLTGRVIGIAAVFLSGILTGLLIQRTWGKLAG